jgi:chitinase
MTNKFTRIGTILLLLILLNPPLTYAQTLVGYWHNWQTGNAPYIPLNQVDTRYNYVCIAFAVPGGGTDYKMEFIPDQVSQATLISQIQTLKNQGQKVIISIGGATAPITLSTDAERDTFIVRMNNIINTYGFEGIDIDLEGSSLSLTGGTISNPTTPTITRMIYAIKQLMANYYQTNGKKLILTMAPETAFVQGGMSAFTGIWGAYLPVIHALRDSLDMLNVQLYNSGSMYGIDGNIYVQGTADFIVAMTEAVIKGFNTAGGLFQGLPASKVGVGLPACLNAAGGGFTDTATVRAAVNYLLGKGPKPGNYTLQTAGGYPTLKGMMTWSINWDKVATCGGVYEFATNYQNIFHSNNCTTCPVPNNNSSSNITLTSTKLNWQTNNCAVGYQVKYKVNGTSIWITTNVNSNTGMSTLTGLQPNTKYRWKVRTKCAKNPNVFSNFGPVNMFTTAALKNDVVNASTLKVYPNPASNLLNIETENQITLPIIILNVTGQMVYKTDVTGNKQIDISNFEKGMYFIRINNTTSKFIKQ